MGDIESVKRLLNELRKSPLTRADQIFLKVVKLFPTLSKTEKDECAQSFYHWAKDNEEKEPLKFCMAELLIGLNYHLADENEQALPLINSSKKHFEELDKMEGVGFCSAITGSIYRTLGNYDLALKTLWEGYGLLKDNDNYIFTLSACAHGMGNINLEMHNYEEALKWFNITYDKSRKGDDFYFTIYALHGLGKIHLMQNKNSEAKESLEKALQIAEENQHPLAIANSISELANFYFLSGNLDEAESLSKKALEIREQQKLTGAAVTSCIRLGEIYIKKSKWDEALAYLYKGLALAELIKVKPKIYQIQFLLSQIFENKNDYKKSLEHFKLYQKVREEVDMEDNARKLADAKLIFEAEQTKKENVIIKKQKEVIEKKNIELQETIDELTITKISRKAKAFTLVIAIIMFILEDFILHFALHILPADNYLLSLIVKMVIIFSLSPINKGIEHFLLKRVIKKKKRDVLI